MITLIPSLSSWGKQEVGYQPKDTNHFLSKLKSLGKLPQGAILYTIDVDGLYPNIPHSEGLNSLRRFLELRDNKQISSDTLIELAEIVLKNNLFEFDQKTFKQVRGTAIGTNFVPPYAILFITDLEKNSKCLWGETYDMVEVHKRYFFYLGTWRRISGKNSQEFKYFSFKDKVHCWVLKRSN